MICTPDGVDHRLKAPEGDWIRKTLNKTSDYFHMVNHELRTQQLERVPKGARTALSVGASGRWWTFDQPWLLFAVSMELIVERAADGVTIRLPVELGPSH